MSDEPGANRSEPPRRGLAGGRDRPPAADPATPAAVEALGLTVVRGGRSVLHDVALTVAAGAVTGLLGPSGCGKTTLLRSVVGTQARVRGRLRVLGLPAGDPGLRSRIGYVTQEPSVYRDLTIRQNLDYYAAVLGVPRRHRAAEVERVLGDVDLLDRAGALTADLSGGQLSRASLAVALLGRPELLVLDEPTVGLDPVLRRDLWRLFHRLADRHGVTLLVSSHVMDEADRCDRLLLMREGRVLADDTPDGLRRATGATTVENAFLHLVESGSEESEERGPR
ncbi:ABC transporter ATP-binding protein [Streptomyces spiramenti]|uniref:ABC transporter ATP-binding protein n=1 Tax=Streptomyces spiramenti TaxID=2720606 RepID=A0ABX1AS20_9ACTN|nr:ABC transporter ATP-binding protein [Streptomyces spiramenti]